MASTERLTVSSINSISEIGDYLVNMTDVLGNGSYGVVFSATDKEQKKVAMKRIDKSKLSRNITDMDKLLTLQHVNITSVYNIIEDDRAVWMALELCNYGNLNKFVKGTLLSLWENVLLMKDIAGGVFYLHRKDIIHRDIKPGNILIAKENRFRAKLADFDLSKFLEEDYETSMMSSNVGTQSFKAPEFFLRNEKGKLNYHRNVDVFATGLTFLAILQMDKENRKLVPHIETLDDPDPHTPIGQTLANIKKKNEEMPEIVQLETWTDETQTTDEEKLTLEFRKLIRTMTCFEPKNRKSAAEVLISFQWIKVEFKHISKALKNIQNPYPKAQALVRNDVSNLHKFQSMTLEVMPPPYLEILTQKPAAGKRQSTDKTDESSSDKRSCNEDSISESGQVGPSGPKSWDVKQKGITRITMSSHGQVLFRGSQVKRKLLSTKEQKQYISFYEINTGKQHGEIVSKCRHGKCVLIDHPAELNKVIEACNVCALIRSYNTDGSVSTNVYEEYKALSICKGPEDTLFVTTQGKVSHLQWNKEKKLLDLVREWQVDQRVTNGVCYSETFRHVILTSSGAVRAWNPRDKSPVWQFSGPVDGDKLNPLGVCCIEREIYVADGSNKRIVVFNGETGAYVKTVLNDKGTGYIHDVCWNGDNRHLVVLHGTPTKVSVYFFPEQALT